MKKIILSLYFLLPVSFLLFAQEKSLVVASGNKVEFYSATSANHIRTSERRIALLLGASSYNPLAYSPIPCILQDIEKMRIKLNHLNFDVLLVRDGSKKDFENAIDSMICRLNTPQHYGLSLFYCSSHGEQSGTLQYIIPNDFPVYNGSNFKPQRANFCNNYALDLAKLLRKIDPGYPMYKIALFDACRTEFTKGENSDAQWEQYDSMRTGGQILLENSPYYILFGSTTLQPTYTSSIGTEGNSRFTHCILENLDEPNLRFEEFVNKTAALASTFGQRPYVTGNQFMDKNFYLNPHSNNSNSPIIIDKTQIKKPPVHESVVVEIKERGLRVHGDARNGKIQLTSCPLTAKEAAEEIAATMVLIKGGDYEMGCTSEQMTGLETCFSDEKPSHLEKIEDFKLNKFEITQAQYRAIMEGSTRIDGRYWDCAQVDITWYDAKTFCEKLNIILNTTIYRLPEENEWEYAAREGEYNRHFKWSGCNDSINLKDYVVYNSGFRPVSVGSKKPNLLGLYDMSGNAWEWTNSYYCSNYLTAFNQKYRVVRGGGFEEKARFCRVSVRSGFEPKKHVFTTGFRVASKINR